MCVSKDATYSITTYVVGAEKPDESCDVLESEDNGFGLDQVPPSPNTAPLFMRSVETQDSVQIASHKIIFVFMQKFSMFLNSIKLHLVFFVTTRHRAF